MKLDKKSKNNNLNNAKVRKQKQVQILLSDTSNKSFIINKNLL